ncbi:VOC family protein [Phenylobacterium sp.]|jgi:catechol 2,3-dioxygenase-like lactoylglutathione lyase family enzyme|uniref:VOC family protein n=1 Tax=Phenylobacterium sp. TaxID=1871053 RepID=UPI002E37FF15|nr:VOC family protein [Phenylobacterium sp.]HEX2561822.1 VOC family protein [Phenylobacterium sp.]
MILGLDHVAVSAADLEAGARAFVALLGREPERRDGEAWFQLPNMALRLRPGEADAIVGLAFRSDDPGADLTLLTRRGLAAAGSSLDAAGIAIELAPGAERSVSAPTQDVASAVAALDHVVIRTRNIDRAVANFGGRLGLDLRLDRANEAWGARQLFFRCGGAVIEFGASLKSPPSDEPDSFGGLAWRVSDPDAAHARIAAAGFDVSEVRTGRKPGTKVFTVRSGVPGAPSLMIQQGAEDPA